MELQKLISVLQDALGESVACQLAEDMVRAHSAIMSTKIKVSDLEGGGGFTKRVIKKLNANVDGGVLSWADVMTLTIKWCDWLSMSPMNGIGGYSSDKALTEFKELVVIKFS